LLILSAIAIPVILRRRLKVHLQDNCRASSATRNFISKKY